MAHKSLISKIGIGFLASSIGVSLAGASLAGEVGLLGFFQVSDGAAYSNALEGIEAATAPSGCTVRRQGELSGTRGPLSLPEVNRFLLLQCESKVLASGQGALEPLAQQKEFVLLEGEARFAEEDASAVAERSYVVKLSRFNDGPPDVREKALASIGRDVAARSHAYQDEAVIEVDRAWGIPTPDDVTVLFYRSSADGKAFREQNPDIMKRIGEFNEAHVEAFAYAGGTAER